MNSWLDRLKFESCTVHIIFSLSSKLRQCEIGSTCRVIHYFDASILIQLKKINFWLLKIGGLKVNM